MSVVHDTVEQRVGYCRIRDVVVPLFDRKLAGEDGRSQGVAIVEDLEHVAALDRAAQKLTQTPLGN